MLVGVVVVMVVVVAMVATGGGGRGGDGVGGWLWGRGGAIIMAKTWSSNMQHLYTIWLGKHDESYVFTDEDLDSWAPPPEYGPHHESVVGHNRATSIELQKMRPRRIP